MRLPGAFIAIFSVATAMGVRGMRGGDPVAADALWQWAQAEAAGDLAHPAYLDAARDLAAVRPWQPGFATARDRLRRIGAARRAQLATGARKGEAGQEGGDLTGFEGGP